MSLFLHLFKLLLKSAVVQSDASITPSTSTHSFVGMAEKQLMEEKSRVLHRRAHRYATEAVHATKQLS